MAASTPPPVNPVHHHYLVSILGMIIIGIVSYYVTKSNSDEKYRKAMEETVTAVYKQLGVAAQAQGHVINYDEIAKRTKDLMAPQLLAEISKQNGTINMLASAVGKVEGKITDLKQPVVVERQADGSFKVVLEQNRDGLPPLTNVAIDYNAKDPNIKTALVGKWIPNKEEFSLKFVKWTGEGGGFRSAAQLERNVFTPKGDKLGQTETIPIISNDAFFLKDDLQNVAPFPKYTGFLGMAFDRDTGKKRPSFYLQKHLTRTFAITTGYVNNGFILGGAYSWGKK